MDHVRSLRRIFSALSLMALLVSTSSVFAGATGFRIGLDATSDLGGEFSGGAAVASDATTNIYNPAGIMRFDHKELSVSAVGVLSETDFKGTATAVGILDTRALDAEGSITLFNNVEEGKANTHSNGVIPAMHFVAPINDQVGFGISVVVPYGLSINYGKHSILRYAARQALASSILISPSLALRIDDHISVGGGPDVEYFSFAVSTMVFLPNTFEDSKNSIRADSWELGWHAGILWEVTHATRVGFSYRSRIVHHLEGSSDFYAGSVQLTGFPFPGPLPPPVIPIPNGHSDNFKADIALPSLYILSAFHDINDRWAVMGTVDFTRWEVFKNVALKNVATPIGPISRTSIQGFDNSYHASVSTKVKLNRKWLVRFGVGTGQTPTTNRNRSVLIPNADYVAITCGGQYAPNKNLSIDFGVSHSFLETVDVMHVENLGGGILLTETGKSDTSGDVAGIQINWKVA